MEKQHFDYAVIGSGLVGLTAAHALAKTGASVSLIAPDFAADDKRTTAVLMESVAFLRDIGLWEACEEDAHALRVMRIVDGSGRLIRARPTEFEASELGLAAFGYSIKNSGYVSQAAELARKSKHISPIELNVERIEEAENGSHIHLSDGSNLTAATIIGADGRNSMVRASFGLGERRWSYPQKAMVLDFEHEMPTRFVSTEFHTEHGPFTVVPQAAKRAGLVWMDDPSVIDQYSDASEDELALEIERRMQSYLGKIKPVSARQTFAMEGLIAKKFGNGRAALVGEAAHVFPPIGAQGFNLGIRDCEALMLAAQRPIPSVGEAYDKARRVDVTSRTFGVDLLNRSLLSDFLPVQIGRSVGLAALANISPLRKIAMRAGISPRLNSKRMGIEQKHSL